MSIDIHFFCWFKNVTRHFGFKVEREMRFVKRTQCMRAIESFHLLMIRYVT